MGFFSKITRAITKPIKKVIKSPIGKAALLGLGAYYGPSMMGKAGWTGPQGVFAGGGKGSMMAKLFGTQAQNIAGPVQGILGTGSAGTQGLLGKWGLTKGAGSMMPTGLGWAGIAGLGTAAAAAGQPKVDEIQGFGDEGKGHQAYLNARRYMPFGDESSPHYTAPMWNANQGGRVRAQEGMYAGQGIESLQSQTDLDNVSQPVDQGVLDSGTTEQSDDAKLIQLIQQLAALGIPMEQLRGRTEQELVEMMVYLSSQMGSQQGGNQMAAAQGGRVGLRTGGDNSLFLEESSEVIRGGQDGDSVVDETENIEVASDPSLEDSRNEMSLMLFGKPIHELTDEELQILNDQGAMPAQSPTMANQGGLMRTGYAMGTEHPIIPSKDGKQLDMRDTGGYQPHGAKEKHDDVRALLAQGEFVMTSDAVKGLGGGDREAGAKKMYDVMHNLEAMA